MSGKSRIFEKIYGFGLDILPTICMTCGPYSYFLLSITTVLDFHGYPSTLSVVGMFHLRLVCDKYTIVQAAPSALKFSILVSRALAHITSVNESIQIS